MCRGFSCGRLSRIEKDAMNKLASKRMPVGGIRCMCYARYYMGPLGRDDVNRGYSRGDFSSLSDYARIMMGYHETKTGC